MELQQFEGQNKKEISMIEVAHAVLGSNGEIIEFSELLKEIAGFLELSDKVVSENMNQFYTDLNIDGRFISFGNNRWGLREWYPIDGIDEEITHDNDEDDERPKRKKRKKYADEDEDEDFEDEDFEDEEDYDEDEDEEDDDKIEYGKRVKVSESGVMVDEEDAEDLGEYADDLSELGDDSDGSAEEELTIIDESDLDDEDLDDEDLDDEDEE